MIFTYKKQLGLLVFTVLLLSSATQAMESAAGAGGSMETVLNAEAISRLIDRLSIDGEESERAAQQLRACAEAVTAESIRDFFSPEQVKRIAKIWGQLDASKTNRIALLEKTIASCIKKMPVEDLKNCFNERFISSTICRRSGQESKGIIYLLASTMSPDDLPIYFGQEAITCLFRQLELDADEEGVVLWSEVLHVLVVRMSTNGIGGSFSTEALERSSLELGAQAMRSYRCAHVLATAIQKMAAVDLTVYCSRGVVERMAEQVSAAGMRGDLCIQGLSLLVEKLAARELAACFSPDVVAHIVAQIGSEAGGDGEDVAMAAASLAGDLVVDAMGAYVDQASIGHAVGLLGRLHGRGNACADVVRKLVEKLPNNALIACFPLKIVSELGRLTRTGGICGALCAETERRLSEKLLPVLSEGSYSLASTSMGAVAVVRRPLADVRVLPEGGQLPEGVEVDTSLRTAALRVECGYVEELCKFERRDDREALLAAIALYRCMIEPGGGAFFSQNALVSLYQGLTLGGRRSEWCRQLLVCLGHVEEVARGDEPEDPLLASFDGTLEWSAAGSLVERVLGR